MASAPQGRPSALAHRRKVLLVESERAFGNVLSTWLGDLADCDVIQAASLHNAKAVLKANRVDLLLAAVELSDGNGLELLKEAGVKRVPRLFLSELGPADRERLAQTLGVGILEKPVPLAELRNRVRALMLSAKRPANTAPSDPPPPTAPESPPVTRLVPTPPSKDADAPVVSSKRAESPAAPRLSPASTSVEAPRPQPKRAEPPPPAPPRPVPVGMRRLEHVSSAPEQTPAADVQWPKTQPPPSRPGNEDGPRTIPFGFAATTPAAESFDEIWEQAREMLAMHSFEEALPLLKRAEQLRPGEERVMRALRHMQIMGLKIR